MDKGETAHASACEEEGERKDGGDTRHRVLHEREVKVVRQPGDGNCLFHCLCYGSVGRTSDAEAKKLRVQIARYIRDHEETRIGGVTIGEWVTVEIDTQCQHYAAAMEKKGWGGAIELAVFASAWDARVQTFKAVKNEFGETLYASTAGFGNARSAMQINLLFVGDNHYDILRFRKRGWTHNGHGRWMREPTAADQREAQHSTKLL